MKENQTESKCFSDIGETDTVTYEATKKITLKRTRYRIRRGHTIIIHRCHTVMQHLWQTGHLKRADQTELDQAIFYCVGGDYRTLKRYRGFDLRSKGNAVDPPRLIKHVPGHLERLRYIERAGDGGYYLNHYLVPLDYHYDERFPASVFSVCHEVGGVTMDKMCVCNETAATHSSSHEKGAAGGEIAPIPTTTYNKQQQHNTHTNQLSESILNVEWIQNRIHDFAENMLSPRELAVLRSASKEGS